MNSAVKAFKTLQTVEVQHIVLNRLVDLLCVHMTCEACSYQLAMPIFEWPIYRAIKKPRGKQHIY